MLSRTIRGLVRPKPNQIEMVTKRLVSQVRRAILLAMSAFALLVQVALAEDFVDESSCEGQGEAHIWVSPLRPEAGAPLKIMAVSTDAAIYELVAFDSEGRRVPIEIAARGGPPWSLSTTIANVSGGSYRVEVWRDRQAVACRQIHIGRSAADSRPAASGRFGLGWNLASEAYFSAWIEQLFDAPPEESLSFPSLEPALRNPARNFLHNHLGLGEDRALPATPDCADFPFFLRTYFAWKMGLPISFRACSRGTSKAPPRCGRPTIKEDFTQTIAPPSIFKSLTRELADAVHSGSFRTALDDDATDFYPVELSREALWPGTVYADPYGHVLLLVKWVRQTATRPGLLFAVDGQPDNSVTRKRFWEGTFLYADVRGAGPGFKAFRPVLYTTGDAASARTLSNDELVDSPTFLSYSLEQEKLTPEDFYAWVGKLINPQGLSPKEAYEAALDALVEQLETRVTSVDNGEAYFRRNLGGVIPMPEGVAIFETGGPWEDYSTPSRDMRVIIAMNVLTRLPERMVRHPESFVMDGELPPVVKTEIEQYHAQRIQERSIQYTRSDGSPWRLSVADVLARKLALEMAYNPNDCAEIRWGAREGTTEYATCKRHAPAAQRARMQQYRPWFHEARRPPR